MIKAVIFDCFEVVLLNASGHFFDKYVKDKSLKPAFMSINEASDRGELDYDQRMAGLAGVLGKRKQFLYDHLYEDLIYNNELLEFIKSIRAKGKKTALLSNTGKGSIDQFFSRDELVEYFDDVVLSYEVGIMKPSKEIFDLAAQRLHVKNEECLFVDDSIRNCLGSEKARMVGIRYNNFNELKERISLLL